MLFHNIESHFQKPQMNSNNIPSPDIDPLKSWRGHRTPESSSVVKQSSFLQSLWEKKRLSISEIACYRESGLRKSVFDVYTESEPCGF